MATTLIQGELQDRTDSENNEYYLKIAILEWLSRAKANAFISCLFNDNEDLDRILYRGKWNKKWRKIRFSSTLLGEIGVNGYISNIDKKTTFKLVNILNYKYADDILVEASWIDTDRDPVQNEIYLYESWSLNQDKGVFVYASGNYKFNSQTRTWDIDLQNQSVKIREEINMIPLVRFQSSEYSHRIGRGLEWFINTAVHNLTKINDDLDIGTNKFLISLRKIPAGAKRDDYIKFITNTFKQGALVMDDYVANNPNAGQAINKSYGSLQTDQLWNGQKMIWGLLKEMSFIMIGSNSKNSAQQNNMEIAQDNQLVRNDDLKLKDIWESQFQEMAIMLLTVDRDLGRRNTKVDYNIKCTIKLEPVIDQINNNDIKNGINNGNI